MNPGQGKNVLLELRDIHMPPDVSWWPPAVGWWIVGGVLLALLILGPFLYRWIRRATVRSQALNELEGLKRAYQETGDVREMAQGLSILLKRVALVRFGRRRVAHLHGADWLEFLRATGGEFSGHLGEILANAPYLPPRAFRQAEVDGATLAALAEKWIRRVTRPGRRVEAGEAT